MTSQAGPASAASAASAAAPPSVTATGAKPRPPSQRSTSTAGMAAPVKRLRAARRRRPRGGQRPSACHLAASGSGARASRAPARISPPATSAISAAARSAAARQISGSAPRSKRWLASVWRPRPPAAARTAWGSKWALSSRIAVVAAVTSVASPPITPASATGRSASAITSMVGGERPPLAVEGGQLLARPRPADADLREGVAAEGGEVEGVERLAGLPEDEVGDVDDVVDRPLADGGQAPDEPLRAGADLRRRGSPGRRSAGSRRDPRR